MKHVRFYESADDVLSKAPPHCPAHQARLQGVPRPLVRRWEIRECNEVLAPDA